MVIGDIVLNNARHFPDRIGLIDGQTGRRLTWREANQRVNRLADGLRRWGIRKGERVAIISENSIQCAEFYFAVAKLGAIGCGLNYRLQPGQIAAHLRGVAPRLVFHQEQYRRLAERALAELGEAIPLLAVEGEHSAYENLIGSGRPDEPDTEIGESDPLMITYSSGTTGLPKGVVATHRNRLAYCIESVAFGDRYAPEDVVLNSAPFCAGVSGQAQLGAAAFVGSAVIMHVLKGDNWAAIVERERVTVTVTTKARLMPVWSHLAATGARHDLSSLRRVTTGGQSHTAEEIRQILDFCQVSETGKMYGLSETTALGTRLLAHEVAAGLSSEATETQRRRLRSVGKPLLSTRIRIADTDGNALPPGEIGEVLIKGDCVSPMYWNNPELTAKAFVDGWFRTNDMGVLDEDGYLYLKGRKDFMINTGGFLVSPIEVEAVLQSHPSVLQVAVLGVPDPRWGEAVVALVRLKEDAIGEEADLKSFCRSRLAGYQVPKRFQIVDDLPMDEAGRINLQELRRRLAHDLT